MKLFIHGFYGAGNAGDDAILEAIIETVKEIDNNMEIVVSIRSKNIPAYYGKESIQYVLGTDIPSVSKELETCSLLIVGGGGLFQDYNSFDPGNLFTNQRGAINYYTYPIILAKMMAIRVMFYGIGVGPLEKPASRTAMRWIGELADDITVRDMESYQLLKEVGVTKQVLTADPVTRLGSTYTPDANSMENNKQLKIGINLRNWTYAEEDAKMFQQQLIRYLHFLAKAFPISYYVMPFNKLPSELVKAEQIARRLGNAEVIPYNSSPKEYKYLCQQLDLMIAMRLHANIFSIYEGVPSVGISYDGKVEQFFQEINLTTYCHSLSNYDLSSFKQIIQDILNNPAHHRKVVQDNLSVLKEREKMNKEVLAKAIELSNHD
ncbi:MAG: polysaccharide pyruvyl transferase family protein [Bacillota bacterium]|nr:polysaccharide pyruvyl transferase family protein [Bacillota bacterium]